MFNSCCKFALVISSLLGNGCVWGRVGECGCVPPAGGVANIDASLPSGERDDNKWFVRNQNTGG